MNIQHSSDITCLQTLKYLHRRHYKHYNIYGDIRFHNVWKCQSVSKTQNIEKSCQRRLANQKQKRNITCLFTRICIISLQLLVYIFYDGEIALFKLKSKQSLCLCIYALHWLNVNNIMFMYLLCMWRVSCLVFMICDYCVKFVTDSLVKGVFKLLANTVSGCFLSCNFLLRYSINYSYDFPFQSFQNLFHYSTTFPNFLLSIYYTQV